MGRWVEFRGMVAAKLGRCPACMRLSLACALMAWGAALLGGVLWPGGLSWVASLVGAAGLSLLYLAHLLTYAYRASVPAPRQATCDNCGPSRRGFLGSFARGVGAAVLTSMVWSVPRPGEAAVSGKSLLRQVLRTLRSPHQTISRNELARIAVTDHVSLATGQPFAALFAKFQDFAGIDQQGEAPTTVVDGGIEQQLEVDPETAATFQLFQAAEGQQINRVRVEHTCSEPLFVLLEGPGLLATKQLRPGEVLDLTDPVEWVVVLVVVAVGVTLGCLVILAFETGRVEVPVHCQFLSHTFRCSICKGDCIDPLVCVPIGTDSCWFKHMEPTDCACRQPA